MRHVDYSRRKLLAGLGAMVLARPSHASAYPN